MLEKHQAWARSESRRYSEAVDIAIECIDKQIPKKPLKEICGDRCPVCGSWVWGFTDKRDFCGKCSQAIDWSDEK